MTSVPPYEFRLGEGPLLVSMPHVGLHIPDDILSKLTSQPLALHDSDWHVDGLYDFLAAMDVSVLKATHSRTVVDLNRPADGKSLYPGQATTGLCPMECFDGTPLYQEGAEPSAAEIARRVELYWQPYHDKLAAEISRIKAQYGFALLWDAHSIKAHVPRLFEGQLPDFNFGTNGGETCDPALLTKLLDVVGESSYSAVANGRFKGGYITRNYGVPSRGVAAVQLELSQSTYLDEAEPPLIDDQKASRVRPVLEKLITTVRQFTPS